jgi:hypothetical protein
VEKEKEVVEKEKEVVENEKEEVENEKEVVEKEKEVVEKEKEVVEKELDGEKVCRRFLSQLIEGGCIVSLEEVFTTSFEVEGLAVVVVGRVVSVDPINPNPPLPDEGEGEDLPEGEEGQLREEQFLLPDHYRGLVTNQTNLFLTHSQTAAPNSTFNSSDGKTIKVTLVNNPSPPPPKIIPDLVTIFTNDGEQFPIKRLLLRPCISLTSLVQAGRGKFSSSTAADRERKVDVDACTFDRVLLYLEHEARGDPFFFDPFLAGELRDAADILGVIGLRDICDKMLGSFTERVRKTPIRLNEVCTFFLFQFFF